MSPMDREIDYVFSVTSAALTSKLIRCNRSAPTSDYSKQGDTPSARLSKLGCGLYRRQQHTLSGTSTNQTLDIEPIDFRKPKYIEKGDPLQDDEKLLQGLPIVEPRDEAFNTIRKVPSDQALMPLRWGSTSRVTGRSKSGLQVSFFPLRAPMRLLRHVPRVSYSRTLSCDSFSISKNNN